MRLDKGAKAGVYRCPTEQSAILLKKFQHRHFLLNFPKEEEDPPATTYKAEKRNTIFEIFFFDKTYVKYRLPADYCCS